MTAGFDVTFNCTHLRLPSPESSAKPGQILVSESTYKQVADEVEARCLGVMSVKGKEEEVTVYEILGLSEQVGARDGAQQQVA